jgi:hypothetical protein
MSSRCGCCVTYEIVPEPPEPCADITLQYGVIYDASLQLSSGSCVSGVWGFVNPPSAPETDAPVLVNMTTSSSTISFKKSLDHSFVGPIGSDDDVLIFIGGRQVLWFVPQPIAYDLLQLSWSTDVAIVDVDVAKFKVQSCARGTSAGASEAHTCIVTQILPVYVPPLSPSPPVSDLVDKTFVALYAVDCSITGAPGSEVALPSHAVVFSKYKQLGDLAGATTPPFPVDAFASVLWRLAAHVQTL